LSEGVDRNEEGGEMERSEEDLSEVYVGCGFSHLNFHSDFHENKWC